MNYCETEYLDYGKCLKIDNGTVEAIITLDIGPRIISFSFIGGENVLHHTRSDFEKMGGECFDKHFFDGAYWENLGGHRLWVSPESMPETYYPDTFFPVEYQICDNTVTLTQHPQSENGVALKMEITLDDGNEMKIRHTGKNISDKAKEFSLWPITVMDKSGIEIIPLNTEDTGLLSNRLMAFWPYSKAQDPRVFIGTKYITIVQDPDNKDAYKLGTDNKKGIGYYVIGDNVFTKSFTYVDGEKYPDGGMSYESYTNNAILEFETLSPLKEVPPQGEIVHDEVFALYKKPCDFIKDDEKSIDDFIKKIAER